MLYRSKQMDESKLWGVLRIWLKQQGLLEITDFGDLPVFENATTYPCILRIVKDKPNVAFHVTQVEITEILEFR